MVPVKPGTAHFYKWSTLEMEMFLQRHTARCKGEQNDPNTRSASALLAIAFDLPALCHCLHEQERTRYLWDCC